MRTAAAAVKFNDARDITQGSVFIVIIPIASPIAEAAHPIRM